MTALHVQHVAHDEATFDHTVDFVTGTTDDRDRLLAEAQGRHFFALVHESGDWVAVNLHTMLDVRFGHFGGITYATAHKREGNLGPLTVAIAAEDSPLDTFDHAFGGRRGRVFVNANTDPHTDVVSFEVED